MTKNVCLLFLVLYFYTNRGSQIGEYAFTKIGFNNWKKALKKFIEHIAAVNNAHNNVRVQF